MTATPWHLDGTYLESCNCDAICPCRAVDGEKGGRSTHGECIGALSWKIEDGRAADVDLSGLGVVMASRYHDDEEGSPWSFYLYLDREGSDQQRDLLRRIWTGELGGTPLKQFPWAWKPSNLLGVRAVEIAIDHTPAKGWFRAGSVTVRIRDRFSEQGAVTCVIPGHHRAGDEVVAEEIRIQEDAFALEMSGVCGYETTFSYSSGQ
jgi:hypothetical protein